MVVLNVGLGGWMIYLYPHRRVSKTDNVSWTRLLKDLYKSETKFLHLVRLREFCYEIPSR